MAFESLSNRWTVELADLPLRWLPLIHPYDSDLPLFPIYYFHGHPEGMPAGHRSGSAERVFGYIERVSIVPDGTASATVVTNRDPGGADPSYKAVIEHLVRERLGLSDAVVRADITSAFLPPMDTANQVLTEVWERVVVTAYGGKLPFGRLWDEVLGLGRWVASWYSDGGRKGELIQTHYFAARFGERIQSAGVLPHMDFFLLPSIAELSDQTNPLAHFPRFARLAELANSFCVKFCTTVSIAGVTLSKFKNPLAGNLTGDQLFQLFDQLPPAVQPSATECFNAFGKGPQRTLLFLMMLADLRANRLRPGTLTPKQCGELQDGLANTYQSPKVLQIYAQQSFGNRAAMPIDSWVATFLKYPLRVVPDRRRPYADVFAHSTNLGKVERLVWVAAQARKVHSSACDDALWCLKKSSKTNARGANPLACTACLSSIRNVCPAYAAIANQVVCLNRAVQAGETFSVQTSAGNNTAPGQTFVQCAGESVYEDLVDDYTPEDRPEGFAPFPDSPATPSSMLVNEFVSRYRR